MKNRLKVYRAMYDLTQEQLARMLDVTRTTIYAVENQGLDPSLKLAFHSAQIFKVQADFKWLFMRNLKKSLLLRRFFLNLLQN